MSTAAVGCAATDFSPAWHLPGGALFVADHDIFPGILAYFVRVPFDPLRETLMLSSMRPLPRRFAGVALLPLVLSAEDLFSACTPGGGITPASSTKLRHRREHCHHVAKAARPK